MKIILLALALVSFNVSAHNAANVMPTSTDNASGCKWQKDNGRCIVFNATAKQIICRVRAKSTITKAVVINGWNQTISETKVTSLRISVPARTNTEFIRINKTADGEIIEKMEIRAVCK